MMKTSSRNARQWLRQRSFERSAADRDVMREAQRPRAYDACRRFTARVEPLYLVH
jgi:hypothetical protein